ncbi:hypothetical protein V6N13_109140 [Hibiscus sabdariffa]
MHRVKWVEVCRPLAQGGLGLRRLQTQNEAFLMKLAFNLVSCKEALWVRFLRVKYKCIDYVPSVLQNQNCSRLWKGLSLVWSNVRQNLKWNIGDGGSVDFWFDAWVGELDLLAGFLSPSISLALTHVTVASMVGSNGDWNWPIFQHLLPHHVLLHIAAIKPPASHVASDVVGWQVDPLYQLSMKYAYALAFGYHRSSSSSIWKLIHKHKGVQCIRIFLWLDKLTEFFALGIDEWVATNIIKLDQFVSNKPNWDILFGLLVWNIWKAQNDFVFNGTIEGYGSVVERIGCCASCAG